MSCVYFPDTWNITHRLVEYERVLSLLVNVFKNVLCFSTRQINNSLTERIFLISNIVVKKPFVRKKTIHCFFRLWLLHKRVL